MILQSLWEGLEASAVGTYIASSDWAFPTIETLHVIALVTVVGSIAIMDLRLLGVTSRNAQVTQISNDTLPLTWVAFGIAAITGSLLFVSKATGYVKNPYFLAKMVCLGLAGANMGYFHLTTWRTVHNWDGTMTIPRAGKIAAGLSLAFWFGVIFFGRLIGFTLGIYQ